MGREGERRERRGEGEERGDEDCFETKTFPKKRAKTRISIMIVLMLSFSHAHITTFSNSSPPSPARGTRLGFQA